MALQVSREDQLGAVRMAPTLARRLRAGARFLTVLTLCLCVHFLIVVALLRHDVFEVPVEPEATEVELITEPPQEQPAPEPPRAEPESPPQEPEKPPEKQPEKPAPQSDLDEKPATSAPRVADHEIKNDIATPDKPDPASTAPRQAEKPAPAPPPAPEPPKPEPKPTPPPEATKPPDEAPAPDAETIENATVPRPPDAPAEAPAPPVKQEPQPRPPKTIAEQIAGMQPLPDFQLEAAAKPSSLPPGTAPPAYLSTLYGMIMPKMHAAPEPGVRSRPRQGEVAFSIDPRGRLTEVVIVAPSGASDLDAAAVLAVRRAAPFPPPPRGGFISVRFTYTRE